MMNAGSKMPVFFVGHGSPMNTIQDNNFTRNWGRIALRIPKPKAILAISAHWYTNGTRINNDLKPEMVYDIVGFPKELYEVAYNAPGAPEVADFTKDLIRREVTVDNSWGIDHGTWSVLKHMYPAADVPLFQMSIDRQIPLEAHYKIGEELKELRARGVLIFASGNVVHNLSEINWNMKDGYAWADEFDHYIKENIISGNYENVIHYRKAGKSSEKAFRTPEHFYPLLYILGAGDKEDQVSIYNDQCLMGSLSMTSYLFE